MDQEEVDRRRLRRTVPWQHQGNGVYASSDSMHAVRRLGSHRWQRGIRQPYHNDGEWDFSKGERFSRLRDAQSHVEDEEATRPRRSTMQTTFHDRRGL